MSFAGSFTSTAADGIAGSAVIDPQIALALVRHAVKQVPHAARVWLEDEEIEEPQSDVYARLGRVRFPVDPDGHLGGADIRRAEFEIAVASTGMEDGERTDSNRKAAYAAQIVAALEGRSFVYTPHASEPEGEHVLQIARVMLEMGPEVEHPTASVIVLTAMGQIDRDTGRGVLPIPT